MHAKSKAKSDSIEPILLRLSLLKMETLKFARALFYFSYCFLACRWFVDYSPNSGVVRTLHEYDWTTFCLTVVSAF